MTQITYNDGEPCKHRGCRSHISHPCEGCGRVGAHGVAVVEENPFVKEILTGYQPKKNGIKNYRPSGESNVKLLE
jgi:hypothetical protein